MTRLRKAFLLSLSGVLMGLSLSCLLATGILVSKLALFSKDVDEIVVTWFYMAVFTCISFLAAFCGIGFTLKLRGTL